MVNKSKTVFVTVGSTKFEQLILRMLEKDVLDFLKKNSYDKLVLQIGNGKHEQNGDINDVDEVNGSKLFFKQNVEINVYRYKSSLREDLERSDLVISHAGAGSIIESLEANKPLIVVINESLMNNHQYELAEKMHSEGFLLYSRVSDLLATLNEAQSAQLEPYRPGNAKLFGKHLSSLCSS